MSTIQVESYDRHRNKAQICTINRFDFPRSGALASTFLFGPVGRHLQTRNIGSFQTDTKNLNLRQTLTNKGAKLGKHRKE